MARRSLMGMPAWRLVAAAGLTAAVSCGAMAVARAQDEPTPIPDVTEPVEAISVAFQAVEGAASVGDWQGADVAFNGALDAMDLHEVTIVSALGDPARAVFARVDELVVPLVSALDGEDLPRLRATVALIRQELDALSPSGSGIAPATSETQAVLGWQDALRRISALGGQRAWRDMRNEAMALTDTVLREGADVAAAAGPERQRSVDIVRVFAMRLIAAAQNQSTESTTAATAVANAAIDELLVGLGALPPPPSTTRDDVRMQFKAHHVPGDPGDVVDVPFVAEDVPRIGLGSFDIELGWSPEALRLVDASWMMNAGTAQRDDAAGKVRLALPPAPTGPSGDVELLRLRFEVLSGRSRATDYLPSSETAALSRAVAEARRLVREGDIPNAASELEDAYLAFTDGLEKPGSTAERLSQYGLAAPLAASLLFALDVTSRPAEADAILLALSDLERRVEGTWDSYLQEIGGNDGVPISIEVLEVTDTTGAELATLRPEPGLVRRAESLLPPPTATVPSGRSDNPAGAAPGVITTTVAIAEPSESGRAAGSDRDALAAPSSAPSESSTVTDDVTDAKRPFPLALVVALLVAVGAGLFVVVLNGGDADEIGEGDDTAS